VVIDSIEGAKLPFEPEKNTASAALLEMVRHLGLKYGFSLRIQKGLPLSAGMGGSAASAVGAVVAANQLLDDKLSLQQCLRFALAGEHIASGSWHADNVAPCLFGGLTLVASADPLEIVTIPVPEKIMCVVIHPHIEIQTKASRALLNTHVLLKDHIRQSACLGGLLMGCVDNNLDLIQRTLHDHVIEPQRADQIPGFFEAKAVALKLGALGFSISGSGPSLFAWARSQAEAHEIQAGLSATFASLSIPIDSWTSPISKKGAIVMKVS
jgi:homoserine kinase